MKERPRFRLLITSLLDLRQSSRFTQSPAPCFRKKSGKGSEDNSWDSTQKRKWGERLEPDGGSTRIKTETAILHVIL